MAGGGPQSPPDPLSVCESLKFCRAAQKKEAPMKNLHKVLAGLAIVVLACLCTAPAWAGVQKVIFADKFGFPT